MQKFVHVKLGYALIFTKLIKASYTYRITDGRKAPEILIILVGEAEVIFVQLIILIESDGQSIENKIFLSKSHIVSVENLTN
jgi:hypothetical protein